MNMAAGVLAGDPFRFARRQSDLAVDRQSQLERDARAAEPEAGQPAGQALFGGLAADPELDVDAGGAEFADALAVDARIRVLQRDDNARWLRRDQQVGAGRATVTVMSARLQCDIDGRTGRGLAGLF